MANEHVEALVTAWNEANPYGTQVMFERDGGLYEFTRTRAAAGVVSGQPVVWLAGVSGCWDLRKVFVVNPEEIPKPTSQEVFLLPEVTPYQWGDTIKIPRNRFTPWKAYTVYCLDHWRLPSMCYLMDDHGVLVHRHDLQQLMQPVRPPRPIDLSGFDASRDRVQHIVDGLAVLAREELRLALVAARDAAAARIDLAIKEAERSQVQRSILEYLEREKQAWMDRYMATLMSDMAAHGMACWETKLGEKPSDRITVRRHAPADIVRPA